MGCPASAVQQFPLMIDDDAAAILPVHRGIAPNGPTGEDFEGLAKKGLALQVIHSKQVIGGRTLCKHCGNHLAAKTCEMWVRQVMELQLKENRMRNRLKLTGILTGLCLALCAASTEAIPLSGLFAISGGYLPVSGPLGSPSVTTLDLAPGIDFIDWLGSLPTPGVAGDFFVNSATKDFATLAHTYGKIQDFTFSGSGPFPTTPLVWFQSVAGVPFDLLSVGVTMQSPDFLILTGNGVFHESGFDATPGTFKFTAK